MVKERAEQRQREQAERKKEWKEEREGGEGGREGTQARAQRGSCVEGWQSLTSALLAPQKCSQQEPRVGRVDTQPRLVEKFK